MTRGRKEILVIHNRIYEDCTIPTVHYQLQPTPRQKGATVLVRKRGQPCITEAIGKRTCMGSGKRTGEEGERGGGSRARASEKEGQRKSSEGAAAEARERGRRRSRNESTPWLYDWGQRTKLLVFDGDYTATARVWRRPHHRCQTLMLRAFVHHLSSLLVIIDCIILYYIHSYKLFEFLLYDFSKKILFIFLKIFLFIF